MKFFYLKQKRLFFGLLVSFSFLLIFIFIVQPALDGIRALEKRITRKEEELKEMLFLGEELVKVKAELLSLERSAIGKKEKEALNQFLSILAAGVNIKKNLISIESKHEALSPTFIANEVEIKFEGIPLDGIVGFLEAMKDYQETIHLKRLSLKTMYGKPSLLNCSVIIFALERK